MVMSVSDCSGLTTNVTIPSLLWVPVFIGNRFLSDVKLQVHLYIGMVKLKGFDDFILQSLTGRVS